MDTAKCRTLKAELSAQEAPVVPIERYFDGNDDEASIGCNLIAHPGMGIFREVLVGLTKRPDVEAVYAVIAEVDPGEDFWPFTDTVIVFGRIEAEDLQQALRKLEPDEVGSAADFGIADEVLSKHAAPATAAWWD
jgi:hypothetical protein